MAESSTEAISDPGAAHDAFISYASPDSELARSVVAHLESTGVSCWVAPRDVEPGMPYADSIIRAINGARVLVVLLSKHAASSAHVGKEIERASAKRRPIIALHIDDTPLTPALEYFLSESQWIELRGGDVDAATAPLSKAIQRFAAAGARSAPVSAQLSSRRPPPPLAEAAPAPAPRRRWTAALVVLGLLIVAAGAWLWLRHMDRSPATAATGSDGSSAPIPAAASSAAAAPQFAPPAHSIAVLPFVNMSGDPAQDYFSDGLSEELLNSLTTIPDLHVAARTSSFYFKGKNVDLSEVAHKLNVGAVLEGSVRKAGNQVRITAQLIDAISGYHLWSQTYDRSLRDVLQLQTDIATAVTRALQAKLMADVATTIELGGTSNPQALDAYLRAKAMVRGKVNAEVSRAAIASYDEAIRLDPKFAKAHAAKARAEMGYAEYYATASEAREHFNRARAAAERALELAPDLGEAHSALGSVLETGFFDFRAALAQHQRALALAPSDAFVLMAAGWYFADIGRSAEAVALVRRGVALDQLNPAVYRTAAIVLDEAHMYPETIEAANRALALNAADTRQLAIRGLAQLKLGDAEAARKSCEASAQDWESQLCLALAYHALQRQTDAAAQLAAMQKTLGDASAYQYSEIMAQWGEPAKALEWLGTAYRLHDPGLISLPFDSLMDPLRNDPRFQETLRKLDIPH
ncbi:MAG: TIR domain-containing protein [Sinobacteraceae bacterium]|nr:TIR domain-containing protein [Nevskiaceae bacterium]